jgi:hypothetical protein
MYSVAYDSPVTLTFVADGILAEWGITVEDAMKIARYNLSVRSREPMCEVAPGLFQGPWRDCNAAGRLLLTETLTRLKVRGDVVAMIPGRDYLLVTGSDDTAGLAKMVLAAKAALDEPKANTPEMLRLRGTTWEPFSLPADHPLAAMHAEMLLVSLSADYAGQKKLLEQFHTAKGELDIYVATFFASKRRSDGKLSNCCTWTEAVTLLPKTDSIFFEDCVVPWDAAVRVVGHLMERCPEFQLERWLVEEYPNAKQLAELKKYALPL